MACDEILSVVLDELKHSLILTRTFESTAKHLILGAPSLFGEVDEFSSSYFYISVTEHR
jgi:hypothetical protein